MSEIEPHNQPPKPVIEIQTAPVAKRPGSPMLWLFGGMGGCFLLVLIIVLLPAFLGLNTLSGIGSAISAIFQPRPATATVSTSQTLVTRIQPLGQLVSMRTQLAKAGVKVNIQQGALNACSFSADHVAEGTIEAGIDFTQIQDTDIVYDEELNTYTITLPAAQLTSCSVDAERYDSSTTLCRVNFDEARLMAEYQALTEFRDEAIEGGILNQAQQWADLVLTNFIQALVPESQVSLNFQSTGEIVYPNTCQPKAPDNWSYDQETKIWTSAE